MKNKLRTEQEIEWVNGQVAEYSCTHCDLRYVGRLDEWLPLRDAHWKKMHPRIRITKRRGHRIPSINRTVRNYDGSLHLREDVAA